MVVSVGPTPLSRCQAPASGQRTQPERKTKGSSLLIHGRTARGSRGAPRRAWLLGRFWRVSKREHQLHLGTVLRGARDCAPRSYPLDDAQPVAEFSIELEPRQSPAVVAHHDRQLVALMVEAN